jgi:aldehyde dehydrogenase (NAD+)
VVRPGYFYEPTMLTGIDPDSEMVDVCGPVLVVIPYGDDEDAARIANRCGSGPSGVVFGGYQRAVAVARRVRTGRMSINGGSHLGPESRFGYAEEQGVTVAEGVVALEEYLERKAFAAIVPGV